MSELCMFESEDHIVPHPSDEQTDEIPFRDGRRKRPRLDVTVNSSNSGDRSATRKIGREKECGDIPKLSNQGNRMLEKDSPSARFPSSSNSDSIKEFSSLASENAKTLGCGFKRNDAVTTCGEFRVDDAILNDKRTMVDGNAYSYTLGDICQTHNDLNFFDKNPDDKDSSDFLYYGWPEIGNFEDVDRMFRSCDSTFGLGASKEDELDWFSSPDAIGGSEDVPKSDDKFSCSQSNVLENISENIDASMQNASYSANNSASESRAIRYEGGSWPSQGDESIKHLPFVDGNSRSDGKDEFVPEGRFNDHKKQLKHQNHSGGKRNNMTVEMIVHVSNLANYLQLASGVTSDQSFSPLGVGKQDQAFGPDSSGNLQNADTFVHSDNSLLSDQTSVHPTLSGIKSENDELTSLSPRKSSLTCSQVQAVENGDDPCSVSVETQGHLSGDKFENCSGTGVSMNISGELSFSNAQEGSSPSTGLDDISPEAACFRQLQLVMGRLDLRTKLCIRDSLYRLARSAKQRHNNASLCNSSGNDGDASRALMAEGANKCAGFMDMETDTNPIDRLVAHLLFHRPTDSSLKPAHDLFASRSPITVHGSIFSTRLVT